MKPRWTPSDLVRFCAGILAGLYLLAFSACSSSSTNTVVEVKVNLNSGAAQPSAIVLLRAMTMAGLQVAKNDFSRADHAPLTFPTTFSLDFSATVTGPIKIEVRGLDAAGNTVALGTIIDLVVKAGTTQTVPVWLACFGACPGDGGVITADASADGPVADAPFASDRPPACGNGKVDPGETCDIAIAPDKSGACPPATCDDGIACTTDTKMGAGCNAECLYFEIRSFTAGDGCCPANGTNQTDSDCSATCGDGKVDRGETCDKGLAAGTTGACPLAADCSDREVCTMDLLISANTCSARCVHRPISALVTGDGCCANGATHSTDNDCPVVCGNGEVETGEACDTGIAAGQPGACPTLCPALDACRRNVLSGSACAATCKATPVFDFVSGDGCCPAGGNRNVDSDCGIICGNGVLEVGEICDRLIPADVAGACPTTCPADPTGCFPLHLEGLAASCGARCVGTPVTACFAKQKDGCCPTGCNANADADCSATCDNGVVEGGETCDTKIAAGKPGACPTSCDDGNVCTLDRLTSGATCNARCTNIVITTYGADGCCPVGANRNLDPDCAATCGNRAVEGPTETCDKGLAVGTAGSCPTACAAPASCTRYTLLGDPAACTSRCMAEAIVACASGDGCCPASCSRNSDTDCPAVCGNGVVEPGETCDKAITAGNKGACVASCDDNNACTSDSAGGRVDDCTRTCSNTAVHECASGDKCCPAGCTGETDQDCAPVCGNGVVEKGETCDPATRCPTTCADDGDPCTAEKLAGEAKLCTAVCTHVPITSCSGAASDGCCPTGCVAKADADCRIVSLPPVLQ